MGLNTQMQWGLRRTIAVAIGLSVLVSCSEHVPVPVASRSDVSEIAPMVHDNAPVRGDVEPLAYHLDGDDYPCSTCHEGFEGDLGEEALENQHANITFDHGRNVRCLNCHNPANSDAYADFDGSEIPADNPTLLCAKCHGPHYREWTLDVHGRVGTYWDESFGEQEKLACVQCHNPHRPRFQPMTPEPPPVLTRFDVTMKEKGQKHE